MGGGTPGGVRRRQGVRRPVNIERNACFQGVRKASGTTFGPVRAVKRGLKGAGRTPGQTGTRTKGGRGEPQVVTGSDRVTGGL